MNELIVADMMNKALSPSQYKVNDDFELARQNLIDIITNGNASIASLQQLADQSQAPRFYEVLATMFKVVADANEKLLDLQKKIADLNKSEGTKPTQNITNNLILTTEELRRLIKNDNTAIK